MPAVQLRQLLAHIPDSLNCIAWSSDGLLIATASEDRTVRVWEAESGRLLHTLEGHTDSVRSVAYSGDGRRLASGSDDHTVRVWEAESGRLLHTLEGHTDWVRSCLLYTSPSPRDRTRSRMPSSA